MIVNISEDLKQRAKAVLEARSAEAMKVGFDLRIEMASVWCEDDGADEDDGHWHVDQVVILILMMEVGDLYPSPLVTSSGSLPMLLDPDTPGLFEEWVDHAWDELMISQMDFFVQR